jgi:hypothetical protein
LIMEHICWFVSSLIWVRSHMYGPCRMFFWPVVTFQSTRWYLLLFGWAGELSKGTYLAPIPLSGPV